MVREGVAGLCLGGEDNRREGREEISWPHGIFELFWMEFAWAGCLIACAWKTSNAKAGRGDGIQVGEATGDRGLDLGWVVRGWSLFLQCSHGICDLDGLGESLYGIEIWCSRGD